MIYVRFTGISRTFRTQLTKDTMTAKVFLAINFTQYSMSAEFTYTKCKFSRKNTQTC